MSTQLWGANLVVPNSDQEVGGRGSQAVIVSLGLGDSYFDILCLVILHFCHLESIVVYLLA